MEITKFGNEKPKVVTLYFNMKHTNLIKYQSNNSKSYMEASEPKKVNPISNIIGVNSLRLGGLYITAIIRYLCPLEQLKLIKYE